MESCSCHIQLARASFGQDLRSVGASSHMMDKPSVSKMSAASNQYRCDPRFTEFRGLVVLYLTRGTRSDSVRDARVTHRCFEHLRF